MTGVLARSVEEAKARFSPVGSRIRAGSKAVDGADSNDISWVERSARMKRIMRLVKCTANRTRALMS